MRQHKKRIFVLCKRSQREYDYTAWGIAAWGAGELAMWLGQCKGQNNKRSKPKE